MVDSYKPILRTLEEMVRQAGLELELCTINRELEFPDTNDLTYRVEGASGDIYITQTLEPEYGDESANRNEIIRHNGIYPLEELLPRCALVTTLTIAFTDAYDGKILTDLEIWPNGDFTSDAAELYSKPTYREAFGALLDALTRNSAQNYE